MGRRGEGSSEPEKRRRSGDPSGGRGRERRRGGIGKEEKKGKKGEPAGKEEQSEEGETERGEIEFVAPPRASALSLSRGSGSEGALRSSQRSLAGGDGAGSQITGGGG